MADSFRFSRLYPLLWLFCYCFVGAMTSIIHKRTPTDEDKDVRVKKVAKFFIIIIPSIIELFHFLKIVSTRSTVTSQISNDSTTLFPLLDFIIESGPPF